MGLVPVGGDVAGLEACAAALDRARPGLTGAADTMSTEADDLVGDTGWNGDAATAFRGRWEQDATALVELSTAAGTVSSILTTLAAALSAAQLAMDAAVTAAQAAGLPVTPAGIPFGPYPPAQVVAVRTFAAASQAAQDAAQQARDVATVELHAVLVAVVPGSGEDDLLSTQDSAALGQVLRGYFTIPEGRSAELQSKVDALKQTYDDTRYERKHTPKGRAKGELTGRLAELRAERKVLATDAAAAERLASKFPLGKALSVSVADVLGSAGVELGGRAGRLADGLPGVDVVLAAGATWAQARQDHAEGWSWGHAIAADAGSNAVGLGVGLATDLIPYVGPFLAPITGYGAGAATYEATHEVPWGENIHDHGVPGGILTSAGQTASTVWQKDVVEMGPKLVDAAEHPVDTAESIWHGLGL